MKNQTFKLSACILLYSLIAVSTAFTQTKAVKECSVKEYKASLFYRSQVYPGDALFVKLELTPLKRKYKKLPGQNIEAVLSYNSKNEPDKKIREGKLYRIDFSEKRKTDVLSGALPLSSYLEEGEYLAKVEFCSWGLEKQVIEFDFTVIHKDFISETIPLNATNTSIKTNTSKERMDQINRLNKILETVNPSSVYETSSFIPPTPATRRTSFFADRRIYAYSNGKSSTSLHYGIDYGVPTGSEVKACGRGKVVMAEDRISTGWSVCIEHLPGLYSLYYHMSELNVTEGQTVEKGELIGLSGATGLATGPHLHWEVRLNMEAVSPDFFTEDFSFTR